MGKVTKVVALKRDYYIQVNLEEHIHKQTTELASELGHSASSYIRSLIIADLKKRERMTDSQLADMLTAR